ncbi:MAG: hypothetical protein QGH42_04480 [Kiritimatiellia bacterium]|nr:hypothetical protein [Kiritimatiellia bacterium]MDP6809659.1 hypothetical protein [Kiritimatiellia bacterium]MDP7023491.1 hypothetical protein [Kiritimatiellia bacterium]
MDGRHGAYELTQQFTIWEASAALVYSSVVQVALLCTVHGV